MVLGHECVFYRGGPEQRAVHKGCGMERRTRLDRRGAGESLDKQPGRQLQKRLLVAACASRTNLE